MSEMIEAKLLQELIDTHKINKIKRYIKQVEKRVKTMSGIMTYDGNGDAVFFRGLKWLEEEIFIDNFWGEERESILDIGAGNGRVNGLYQRHFKKIINVDPHQITSPRFSGKNIESFKVKFEDFKYPEKFDVIIFIFSLYQFKNKLEIIEKCLTHLKKDGEIIVIDGIEWTDKNKKPSLYIDFPVLCKKFKLNSTIEERTNKKKDDFKYVVAILRKE